MRVGNGERVDILAKGTLHLRLPSGIILVLNKCYYVPTLSMNIISASRLSRDGYHFESVTNGCSIFKDGVFYVHARGCDGLFILDLVTHINSVDVKRCKHGNDNATNIWHCHLGHIGIKRIKMLHKYGLLDSLDFDSFDTCELCLLGKMTRTPFNGTVERASDLLGLIHTDVCGPMSVATCNSYCYFVTFTDDFSRYGYIYIMKYKSETFEKFKEFQKEVENQLDRKIRQLCSDRGGEYLSFEFEAHLRACGIVAQRTPVGTPNVTVCLNSVTAPCLIVYDP
jgi:hypothetical protein